MNNLKLRFVFVLIIVLMLPDQTAWTACRKKRRKKKAAVTQVAPVNDAGLNAKPKENRNQLVCRFISMGSGIDLTARKQLDDLLLSIEKKSGQALVYDERSWGREGERDLCFHDNTSEQIQNLYRQLKKLFDQNKRVFIELNAVCK